jgi:hypothetical protein
MEMAYEYIKLSEEIDSVINLNEREYLADRMSYLYQHMSTAEVELVKAWQDHLLYTE